MNRLQAIVFLLAINLVFSFLLMFETGQPITIWLNGLIEGLLMLAICIRVDNGGTSDDS